MPRPAPLARLFPVRGVPVKETIRNRQPGLVATRLACCRESLKGLSREADEPLLNSALRRDHAHRPRDPRTGPCAHRLHRGGGVWLDSGADRRGRAQVSSVPAGDPGLSGRTTGSEPRLRPVLAHALARHATVLVRLHAHLRPLHSSLSIQRPPGRCRSQQASPAICQIPTNR